ncbi:MAG: fused MFS/spermidine synthase [Candidatus Omnitrophota bacterium]
MNKKIKISAFILGLSTMITQIVLIRELLVVFYGNELFLGVILASWLFWVAFGSSALGKLVGKIEAKEKTLSIIQLITAAILPLNILFIRNIKLFLNIPLGEIVGIAPTFTACFLSLSLSCVVFGFSFTLISKIASKRSDSPSKEAAGIYLQEAFGASIGGLLFSFFLVRILSPFEVIFIISTLNIISSLMFSKNLVQVLYLIMFSFIFAFNMPSTFEENTRALQFKPLNLTISKDSIYGNISVTKNELQTSFYENGVLMFTYPDNLTSEESVHYTLLEHKDPKKILLIGGGLGGSLKETLKHNVGSIDYVELDPLVIELSKKYLPSLEDNRVNIINTDGRLFVKHTTNSYDVIIVNLPDPHTALINRFYSQEFFKEAGSILKKEGVFSFAASSSENYINTEQAFYLASLYNTLKEGFSDIIVIPGDNAIFIASNSPGLLTYRPDILIDRLKERSISTQFVSEHYIPFRLDESRIKYINGSILGSSASKINKDLRPIGYLYHTALWMSKFHSGKTILSYIERINLATSSISIAFLFLLILLILKIKKSSFKIPAMISIGTTGMSEIAFQIIVILSFQSLYGYMYYKIGLILTSFMIGLLLGTKIIMNNIHRIKNERSLYLKTQIAICIYPFMLIGLLLFIKNISLENPMALEKFSLSFAFLPIIAGFIGGFQWPLANKICLKDPENAGNLAGALYGIDLFGSSVGALLISLIFIPIIGIIESLVLLSMINLGILFLLITTNKKTL